MEKLEFAIDAIERLREKSKLSKDRHFIAAERKTYSNLWIGLPVVLINVFVGTVLVQFLNDSPPVWASILATLLAFSAASLSAAQTFFNFGKAAEGHRSIANRYLELTMACEHLIGRLRDGQIAPETVWDGIDEITTTYNQINVEAEAFTTNERDFRKAKCKTSAVKPFFATEIAIEQEVAQSDEAT